MSNKFDTSTYQNSIINQIYSANVIDDIRHILRADYFCKELEANVNDMLAYYDRHGTLPDPKLLASDYDIITDLHVTKDHALSDIHEFIAYRAASDGIIRSVDYLTANDIAGAKRLLESAFNVLDKKEEENHMWADQIGSFDAPTYLHSPLLVRDTVNGWFGPPGSYKTFVTLDVALKMASGRDGIKKSSICYIAAEGESGINLRAEVWCQHNNVTLAKTDALFITKPVNLLDNTIVSVFIRKMKALEQANTIKFGLFVFDTLSQCMPGADENSAKDMSLATSNLIRIRREMNTTVIFVHHTGKDTTREMRGSSVIKANTDAMVEIVDESLADELFAKVTVKRQKDGPTGQQITYKMVMVKVPRLQDAILNASLVAVPHSSFKTSGMAIAPTAMKKLANLNLLQRIATAVKNEGTVSVSVHHLNKELLARPDTTYYKNDIADVLPFDAVIEVEMKTGEIMKLRRFSSSSKFGEIELV